MKKRYLVPILLLLAAVSLFLGAADISPAELFTDSDKLHVFLISRVPRLISIVIVGAGMAVAGVVMQLISGNRFVAPTTAGTLDFTKLGVLVAILITPSASIGLKMALAFAFALVGTWLFMFIIGKIKLKDASFVPLIGILFGGIVSSITSFIAYRYDLIQNINSWLQGRFALVVTGRYELLYLGVPLVFIVYLYADRFTIAGLGKDFSQNLGLRYKLIVNVGLVLCSLLSAAIVVTVGSVPFIGVIVPNLVRMSHGDNLRKTLPETALMGIALVLLCDIIGRIVIAPYEIPISVSVGTVGGAVFLYLILRKDRNGKRKKVAA